MPGFSTEQYDWSDADFVKNVTQRLGTWTSPDETYMILGGVAATDTQRRVGITALGYFLCSLVPCAKNDPLFVEWSTPVRDHTLQREIAVFQKQANEADPFSEAIVNFRGHLAQPAFPGAPFSMFDFLSGDQSGSLDGDPRRDFFTRWGIARLEPERKILVLAHIAGPAWLQRESLVAEAQKLCFPDGDTVARCAPQDPAVLKLSTARLDQALRLFQVDFAKSFAAGNDETRNLLIQELNRTLTGAPFCPQSPDQRHCPLLDFLITSPEHLSRMSSNADASLSARYGF